MRLLALVLVAACGSSHGASIDAPGSGGDGSGGGDAGIDAPPVRGDVTVHVVDKTGAAQAGAHVVFVDIDASVDDTPTDAAGDSTASVFSGASVTALHTTPGGVNCITTVTQVAPGDVITLDVDAFEKRTVPLDTTSAGTFTVGFPSYAGANHYMIYTPCGGTSTTKTSNNSVTLEAGCVATTMDVLVVAVNSSNAALAFVDQSGVAFTAGGSVTLAGTWATLPTITATYTNASPSVQNVQLARVTPDTRGAIAPPPPTVLDADVTGASTMLQVAAPAPAAAMMQTLAWPCANADVACKQTNSAWQTITQAVDGTQTAYALDVGAQLLPWLGYPVWMKASPTLVHVPVTGSGAIDLFETDMQYVRNNTTIYIWRVFAPTAGDVHFPQLPASVPGDPTPKTADTMSVTHAYACESDAITGYRAAVANVYDALGTCESVTDPTTKRFAGTLNRFSQSN